MKLPIIIYKMRFKKSKTVKPNGNHFIALVPEILQFYIPVLFDMHAAMYKNEIALENL